MLPTIDREITVLVTAIGGPTGYGIVKCLKDILGVRVIGVDRSASCPTQSMVDAFVTVPSIGDPNYVAELRELVRRENVDIVFPTLQEELIALGALRSETHIISSDETRVAMALDKAQMYERLMSAGLAKYVPKYMVLDEPTSLERIARKLGYPSSPICLKPLSGHGGKGFKVLASSADVAARWERGAGWDWSTLRDADSVMQNLYNFEPLLVMEFLPGQEYSVDVLSDDGNLLVGVSRRRSRVSTGVVIDGITERRDDLLLIARDVVRVLGLDYFSNIQFRYDSSGVPKVIDVNPRFCGSQVLSWGAGVNFPLLCIRKAMGLEVVPPSPRWGVQMKRYWESVFFDGNGQSE